MARSVILKNTAVAFIGNVLAVGMNFVVQRIFVSSLGIEYVGVNSVLNSIVTILAMADLGLSGAIIFHLYKPLHNKNFAIAAMWLKFYRRANHVIAIIMMGVAGILTFFVPVFIPNSTIPENIYAVFWLLVASMLFNYLLSYKRALLQADQKNYVISAVHIVYTLSAGVGQILVLALTENFYLFLGVVVVMRLAENVILNRVITVRYKELFENKDNKNLSKHEKKDISRRMRASVFHSTAGYVVSGTDNLILSQLVSVFFVGLFANYYMVLNAIHVIIMQVFSANTATVGHRLVEKDYAGSVKMAKRLMFANSWLGMWLAISIYCTISPFVRLWLGDDYIIDDGIVLVLCISFYLTLVRLSISSVKTAGGIVYEDRFVPLIEAAVNFVASIGLGIMWGAAGVFIGTILSTLLIHFYSYPKFVFKLVLHASPVLYIKLFVRYFAVFAVALFSVFFIKCMLPPMDALAEFVLLGAGCFVLSTLLWWAVFARIEEMQFFKAKIRGFLLGIRRKGAHNE
ncbi:oligosaccharide flippase family protein [Candidatus Saccharibacteria bacterium]|nr:oligosaccharide flippase family protein [Candidatus Saccharibacteria bacterium]